MFIQPVFTEVEANVILEVAKSRSIPDLSIPGRRIGSSMTAEYWQSIAKKIEDELRVPKDAVAVESPYNIVLGKCPEEEAFDKSAGID